MPFKDKEKRKEYQRNFYRQRSQRHRNLVKERGDACEWCGYNKVPKILIFHHLDPSTKLFNVGRSWTKSDEAIRDEIAKCDLICPNCHAETHLPQ